ncbi:MAG TPA: HDIG domain-containing protein [Acidimicrobiia bacterium]|nr:HDIG domain-containing protein [Acidimicrobiia bacterium]
MQRSTLVRIAIFLATVVAAWAVLSLGTAAEVPELEVGRLAPTTFYADQADTVVDVVETERQKEEARNNVEAPREVDADVESTVISDIQAVFRDLEALAVGDPDAIQRPDVPQLPEQETTTTTEGEESEEVTEPADPAILNGTVFMDIDGDGTFNPEAEADRVDRGLGEVDIEIRTHDETLNAVTGDDGTWSLQYPGGPAVVVVDGADPDIPDGYLISTDNAGQLIDCAAGQTCDVGSVGLGVNLRPITEVVDSIEPNHSVPQEALVHLAGVAADDVVRAALGEPLHLPTIQTAAVNRATLEFATRITQESLGDSRANVRNNPPQIFHTDTGLSPEDAAAAGEVVAANLLDNYRVDRALWEQLQEDAANEVPNVLVEYDAGSRIVDQGVNLTPLHIAAINATTAPTIVEQPSGGLLAVIVALVSLIGIYLATFRPEFWSRPRMVALLGIIIVLGAGAVRGTVALEESFNWYVLPAVAFGFVTAVLFDQRIAILMALAVGVLTALGTLDPGASVYGTLAALAPIPFVSAVSTRGAFRNAVVLSALVAAGVAASTSWFFHVGPNDIPLEIVPISVAWAFGVSVFASLLGLAALQFFESAFDITTTLGLLDLTDRNHEALQMLQEKAFGSFNHSLMVGTLADAAARSIGANPLLARAMAYYHDLGKTEQPTFFIENQFGMTNPHDDLDPKESAQIIRDHVTAGVGLARQYKIPTEVTDGIVSHHGDGVMRFFYEKARQEHGDEVDIDDFRHIGHKPRTAETAILMLSDALEAACRAVFQSEEPTPDAIEKVVDRIMNEKREDGQLSESPLTLAELTKIRRAFLDSLIGHYHQRIAYPNFPGS